MHTIRSMFAAVLGMTLPQSKTKFEESLESAPVADVSIAPVVDRQTEHELGELLCDVLAESVINFDAMPSEYPHAAGCVLLINDDGLIATVPRKGNYADMGLPGGKQEHRDLGDLAVTAARELFEETGYSVPASKLVRLHSAVDVDGFVTVTFVARMSDVLSVEQTDESSMMRWNKPAAILGGSYHAYNVEVIRKAGL